MEPRSLTFVAQACGGQLVGGAADTLISRVCTDSRQAQPGDVFFALKGKRFDGHEFIEQAAQRGVAAVVVNRTRLPTGLADCSVVAVENTRNALGRLAAKYRAEFGLPAVAVCGSNGKTTVKEIVAAVVRQRFNTLWNEASFNNEIGVPLTLLRLAKIHEVLIAEAGTNHPGELAPLVRMIQPHIGIITNISREHMEFFGDVSTVAQEEGWLAELLPAPGLLIINGDSEWADYLSGRAHARVARIGFSERNDWRISDVHANERGVVFHVAAPKREFSGHYRINLLGRHQAANALFAVVVGEELGLGRAEIQRGLAECRPPRMRLELSVANGVWVLDDSYNANADSMAVALQTLMELPCEGRRVAVLGEMTEQGQHSVAAHEEIGRLAAQLGVGQLFVVGEMAAITAAAARAAGLARVLEFGDIEAAARAVQRFVKPGDLVLLKASRAARFERLAEALRAAEPKKAECCFI